MRNKILLLQRIHSSRRQLERCIFYFQRSKDGGLEVSGRLKYSEEEMAAPGVAGNWSLKDVLANVSAREQSFIQACRPPIVTDGGVSLMVRGVQPYLPSPYGPNPQLTLAAALERFRTSHREVLVLIQNFEPEALFAPPRLTPIRSRLLIDEAADATYRNYDRAREQIRQWQRERMGRARF